jgi:predicted transcriptional regulator
MFKDEILENEKRRNIYSIIEANPGIHLRELQRITNLPLATLEYHLNYMTRKKIIIREADTHYTRYYTKPLDPEDKKILSALRQERMREIVLLTATSGKAKFQFLMDHLDLPRSTLSFYLKYLVDHNILAKDKIGYENIYTIKDEDRIAKVLIAYRSTFLDKLVDKALATWLETRFRQEEQKTQTE